MTSDDCLTPAQAQRCLDLSDEIVAMSDGSDEAVNSVVALTLVISNVLFQLVKTEYYADVLDDIKEFCEDALDEAETEYAKRGDLQ